MSDNPGELTVLLRAATSGDSDALNEALSQVYDDLRRLAQSHMSGERDHHTLQATALVHETFLKLQGQGRADYSSRGHFFAIASMAMRRILVSSARSKGRQKRGGNIVVGSLADAPEPTTGADSETVIAVNEALGKLGEISPRAVRVVECRYFAGLSIDETAEALDLSLSTVKREWRTARVWLARELQA